MKFFQPLFKGAFIHWLICFFTGLGLAFFQYSDHVSYCFWCVSAQVFLWGRIMMFNTYLLELRLLLMAMICSIGVVVLYDLGWRDVCPIIWNDSGDLIELGCQTLSVFGVPFSGWALTGSIFLYLWTYWKI